MSYDETITERLSAGFLSDTPTGRKQAFFAWFDANSGYEDFDGHEAQRREAAANITPRDWAEYHASFTADF